jgi:formyltetrahydrofolate-dependent phosphoribosylglycinamide formyltransferase
LVVFVSGSGTNLQAIVDAIAARQLNAQISLVVSNRKAAYALVRAQQAGIETLYFPLKAFLDTGLSREKYDLELVEKVSAYQPDLIVLAGWMHVLSAGFLVHFPNRVINLHPALPGTFPGIEAIQRTFEAYQRGEVSHGGCMVHYVVPEVDAGPVIAQAVVPIKTTDTFESFEARMHATEHRLFVDAVKSVLIQLKAG